MNKAYITPKQRENAEIMGISEAEMARRQDNVNRLKAATSRVAKKVGLWAVPAAATAGLFLLDQEPKDTTPMPRATASAEAEVTPPTTEVTVAPGGSVSESLQPQFSDFGLDLQEGLEWSEQVHEHNAKNGVVQPNQKLEVLQPNPTRTDTGK